jgi:SAM-dependent MidA family methyltransferase
VSKWFAGGARVPVHDMSLANAPVLSLLVDRIQRNGPLVFDEFMRVALYDPDAGYFATGPLRSVRDGDFLTSPEVSPLFGETIARFVAAEAERVSADPVDLVEAGAGSGSLLRPLLDALEQPLDAWAVEVSAAAQAALAAMVPQATVVSGLRAVPDGRHGVIIANELLDNLPAALAVRTEAGWLERRVGAQDDALVYLDTEARPEIADWADRCAGPIEPGGIVEVQLDACSWVTQALGLLEAGSLLVFDYGDTAEGLESRRAEGTIRTYRGHHLGPDPLAEPGATDITMDVNFTALEGAARDAGADVEVVRQADFLTEWGLADRLAELRDEELRLARGGDPMERLKVRDLRTGGEALLHPRGLGDSRVLIARV